MPLPQLLGVKDAAGILGISPWTLRKYVSRSVLPCIHLGRRVLIEPSAIEELIERNRRRGV